MLDNWPLLSLITFSPLLGVLVILFLPKDKAKGLKTVAIASTVLTLLLSVLLFVNFDNQASGPQFQEQHNWIKVELNKEGINEGIDFFYQFDYSMGADGLSMSLVVLTALITCMAAFAALHIKKRWKTFYILFLLLQTGMFGVFLAQDLFLFFLFFELTLIPAFFLIGIWGFQERERAANRFLVYNGIGSAIMLIAFLILINTAGLSFIQANAGDATAESRLVYTGEISVISDNLTNPDSYSNQVDYADNPFYLSDAMKWAAFIMLIVAFGIKLPIFPFHTWMLKVHREAHPAMVMIHSGIMLKMGAYGLLRFGVGFFPEQVSDWAFVLGLLGVVNILYGAILAFVQKEFRLVLAYSSISHMGIIILGIAAMNEIGLQGAAYQMVSHGLISALLFLIVGSLYERTKTTELSKLGGLAKSMPFMSGVLLFGGLASLGLPALSGFVAEFMAFLGYFESRPVLTAVGALGIILAAVYVLRAILSITYGPQREAFAELKEARMSEALPMITLVAFILLLGVYPAVLSKPLLSAVQSILGIGG